jgi:NADH:ubiquinone oxidoreductase subunit 4 (subunit M)
MNLILLVFCWGDTNAVLGGILFSAMHSSLSSVMFYLVDCLQRRYNSRSVIEISGVLQTTPNLAISILVMCILYAGLPGTVKFTCEFYVFCGFFGISPTLSVFVFITVNILGLIGFSRCWFSVVFGTNLRRHKNTPLDLNSKELYVILIPITLLIFLTFMPNTFF